jgi:methyltransferase (TIGR00027 family)
MAMSSDKAWVASTARWIAAVRERESARPDRLFDDPYAGGFAGESGRQMMARSEAAGGENKAIPVRIRYFDDLVLRHAAEVEQVVLLGAGFDTRAYRLALPRGLRVFELDAAPVLDEKDGRLAAEPTPCSVRRVAADVGADWVAALGAAGFRHDCATLWLAEGLFFYLSAIDATQLLAATRAASGPGSVFAADLCASGILGLPQMRGYLDWLAANGRPPPFCHDDPAALLGQAGWRLESAVQMGQPAANHGRLHALAEDLPLQPNATQLLCARIGDA